MNADPAPPPFPQRRVKTKSRWADLIAVIMVLAVVGATAVSLRVRNWESISAASRGMRDGLTGNSAAADEVSKQRSKSLEEIEHDKRLEEVDKALAARQKAATDKLEAEHQARLNKIIAKIRRERFAKTIEAIKSPFIKLFGGQKGQKRIEDQQLADNQRSAELASEELERGARTSKPPRLLRLPEETAQPNQSAASNLRDNVLSALEPEIRSHPDVIKSFHNRAKRLKGKIILIGNESLLFKEDTFWEFADALLVKKDTNLAIQKTTQWVKTGGAILTDEHKYSQGLVKSVDGPFYRFICVESTLKGSKTNFWLPINNVSRRSPSDFALAINQYQRPLGSDTEHVVSGHVHNAFSCVYHFSDGGLDGDELSTSLEELEANMKADQDEKDKSASESSPAESTDSIDEMMRKGEERARESFPALEAQRKYEESIGGFHVSFNEEFKLGDYTYKITSIQLEQAVGPKYARRSASEGAWFVLVNVLIRNDGKQTTETDTDDFRLRDADGREFSPDNAATTAVSSGFSLRQLHPGIFKKAITVFEVPISVATTSFKILIPEKGLSKKDRKTAMFFASAYKKASSKATPTPKLNTRRPSHSDRKGKTGAGENIYPSEPLSEAKPKAPLSSDWGTVRVLRNGRYELEPVYYGVYRRKEQIGLEQEQRGEDKISPEQRELWRRMDRPPGTPWRSFSAPDEHGYPNN